MTASIKNTFIVVLTSFLLICCASRSQGQIISTLAGTGIFDYGGDSGPATAAMLEYPWYITTDATGNIFFTDNFNARIRKVDPAGIITTIAGTGIHSFSGDGSPSSAATIHNPAGIVTDTSGNIYFSDAGNHRIRRISATGIISTIAGTGTAGSGGDGGPATAAELNLPRGLAADIAGNIFIADVNGHRVRKISTTGIITSVAGTGTAGFGGDGGPATLSDMKVLDVAVDVAGNLYIADAANNRIRKVNTAGIITTIAGTGVAGFGGDGGPATAAEITNPDGLAVDAAGVIYFSDRDNSRIRKIDQASGIITTVAGTGTTAYSGDGGPATAAELYYPMGTTFDPVGNMYICDWHNSRIRKIASTNIAPHFTAGVIQSVPICSEPRVLDTILTISDPNVGQPITWSLVSAPLHGTATVAFAMPSTGAAIMPAGTMYTPATGYIGPDTVKVKVADGMAADTIIVVLNITDCSTTVTVIKGASLNSRINIIPNPNSGAFTCSFSSPLSDDIHIVITDLFGRSVSVFDGVANMDFNVDLNVAMGVYFIRIATQHGNFSDEIFIK